jgi:hypothetical protein
MSTPPGARRIDGRAIAAQLREQAAEVARTLRERGIQPVLAVADPTGGDEGRGLVHAVDRAGPPSRPASSARSTGSTRRAARRP